MIEVPFYQIDAFADRPFQGNPAAVCLLPKWPDDAMLQAVAQENNLPETAFVVRETRGVSLRWFTPQKEVDLCGHATLAAAHALFAHEAWPDTSLTFQTRMAGALTVFREGQQGYRLDFPSRPAQALSELPSALLTALRAPPPVFQLQNVRDTLLVYANEDDILAIQPDFSALRRFEHWVCVTAPGRDCDFVSRFFTPGDGYDEDPVTGSTHTMLVPYWAERLGKTTLQARQCSARGGRLLCQLVGDRVQITGSAVTVIAGTCFLPEAL